MKTLLKIIKQTRALVMTKLWTKEAYIAGRAVGPISKKYGYDRGNPVDRHFIDQFIEENKHLIKGRCLEVVDNSYTLRFGGRNVMKSDVIDLFVTKQANVHGNLKDLSRVVKSNTYDCLIITQTLHVNDDYEAAISECYRILKPGGVLLATLPALSPTHNLQINMWRFSTATAGYVFAKFFKKSKLVVKSYGNKTAAVSFWSGFAKEEMSSAELSKNETQYPLIIGVRATK